MTPRLSLIHILYVPYLLTCAGMVMMCYIVSFLSSCPTFTLLRGGRNMQGILSLGFGVLSVFSVIFLFYTNSFLIRRRKREFGLYNILGLGKRHLAVVLLWETLFTVFIAFAGGMAGGILLSKLAELIILKMLESPAVLPLSVDAGSILRTLALFAAIFALLYLNALRQIQLANPIDLLRSENTGEKPPKANWLGAVLSLIHISAAQPAPGTAAARAGRAPGRPRGGTPAPNPAAAAAAPAAPAAAGPAAVSYTHLVQVQAVEQHISRRHPDRGQNAIRLEPPV